MDPLAELYGPNVVGIPTGNPDDGTPGLPEIKRHGSVTVVQAPNDAANSPDVQIPSSVAAHVAQLGSGSSQQAGAGPALKLRDLVEQDWITPETTDPFFVGEQEQMNQ